MQNYGSTDQQTCLHVGKPRNSKKKTHGLEDEPILPRKLCNSGTNIPSFCRSSQHIGGSKN